MNTGTTRKGRRGTWLNTAEAAERIRKAQIHMTETRLRQLRSADRGPAYRKRDPDKPRSEVLYRAADVDAWIAQQDPANWPAVTPTPVTTARRR